MKKKFGAVVFAAVLCLGLTGCDLKKEAVTAGDFTEVMEEKGFEIVDSTDQFPEGSVQEVVLALNGDYQVEFYVFDSNTQAESAYEQNRENFESYSDAKSNLSTSIGNYNYYEQTDLGSGGYYVVSQVDNTMFYAAAEKEYKDEIREIMDELGYGN